MLAAPSLSSDRSFINCWRLFWVPFPHIPALPGVLFIKLAHGHFLADGVYPVVKVFLYLLDLLAQGKTGPFPGRYFVGGY